MDYLSDFNAITGVGGFDPIAMYKAVTDISKAFQNPYSDSKEFNQNIADDINKLSVSLSQNPYEKPKVENITFETGSLGFEYSNFKSKETDNLIKAISELSSKYSKNNYNDQKKLESDLLKNEMLSIDSENVKPLIEQLSNPTLDGLLSLGQGVLLFGAMYAISLSYKTKSSNAYESDKAFHKMNKYDSESLAINPDIWELASNGNSSKGIMEVLSDGIISHEKKEQEKSKELWKEYINLKNDLPIQVVGNDVLTDIPEIQNQIEYIYQIVEKKINEEIKNKSISNYTKIATNLKDGSLNTERGINYGLTDIKNFTDIEFPTFAKDKNTVSDTFIITDKLNSTFNFETEDVLLNQNLSIQDGDHTYSLNLNPKKIPSFKGWGILNKNSRKWELDPINSFSQKTPFSDYIKRIQNIDYKNKGKQPPGTVKFFIEKLHGVQDDKITSNKLNPIKSNLSADGFDNRCVFSAYIDSYSETYTPSFDTYNFIGRGEGFPIYKSTTRSLNITFNIIADYSLDILAGMAALYSQLGYDNSYEGQLEAIINTKQDWGLGYIGLPGYAEGENQGIVGSHVPGKYSDTTDSLWEKTTFLAQCCYAYYRPDGKMKEQPMIRLRLGDYYDNVGYIESLTMDSNEFENILDLNPTSIGNIPLGIKVSISMKVLHNDEPSSNFTQFYHRREFDDGTETPQSIVGRRNGTIKNGLKKQSPLRFDGNMKKSGITETPTILSNGDANKLNDNLQNFTSKFADIKNMGLDIDSLSRKIALENAMKSYVKVSDMADQLSNSYGYKLIKPKGIAGDITSFAINNKNSNNNNDINSNPSQIDIIKQNNFNSKQKNDPLYSTDKSSNTNIKGPSDNQNNNIVITNKPQTQPKTLGDIMGSGGNG